MGALVTPIIGAAFILSGVEHSRAQLQAMTPAALQAYRAAEASTVKIPYLVITGLFLAVAIPIYCSDLPEIREEDGEAEPATLSEGMRGLWHHKHLVKGVIAQFFYVGAQVGVASFVIRFAQYTIPGTPEKMAANYLKLHLLGFMIGRFTGSAIMKHVAAPRLLSWFGFAALTGLKIVLLASGTAPHMGPGPPWFLSLDLLPHNFCFERETSGALHQAGIIVSGHGNYWRRPFFPRAWAIFWI